MKEFKVKSKHLEFPELLKNELDTITRHDCEVVDVKKNCLVLDETVKTYNFLIPANTKEMREFLRSEGYGYAELEVNKKFIPLIGYSFYEMTKPNRSSANYLLVKSVNREEVPFYRENLKKFHREEFIKNIISSGIFFVLFLAVLFTRNIIASKIGTIGYYAIQLIIIVFLFLSFYPAMKHKNFEDA